MHYTFMNENIIEGVMACSLTSCGRWDHMRNCEALCTCRCKPVSWRPECTGWSFLPLHLGSVHACHNLTALYDDRAAWWSPLSRSCQRSYRTACI